MGICSTVRDATDAIAESRPSVLSTFRRQVEVLRRMPEYEAGHDLGAWERTFMSLMDDRTIDCELGGLLWDVFEFGRFNLYSSIQVAETEAELSNLRGRLLAHGVRFDARASVGEW